MLRVLCCAALLLTCGLIVGCGEPAWRTSAAESSAVTGAATTPTRFGQPIRLAGNTLAVGDRAPDVTLVDRHGRNVRLSSLRGKVVLLSVVPDINTPVCASTTRRLNALAPQLGEEVAVLTVSADSPHEQDAWAAANNCRAVALLSDDLRKQFGRAFGVAVAGEPVLARSMFVIDREGVIRHIEVVGEQTDAPDGAAALAVVRRLRDEEPPPPAER
jgi:thiol peroxidase